MLLSLMLAGGLLAAQFESAHKSVRQLRVENTRLSRLGVAKLTELTAGTECSKKSLDAGVARAIDSGLVREVKIRQEPMPDRDTEVIVTFELTDEPADARASIQIPKVNEAAAWKWLEENNELIVRELPANEKALAYYSGWIEKYMDENGPKGFSKTHKVVAQTAGKQVVFKAVKR